MPTSRNNNPSRFVVNVPRNINHKNMQAVGYFIRTKAKEDPQFLARFKKDPLTVLVEFGINRKLAINIMADEAGVTMAADTCVCTGCCCTGCCISSGIFVREELVFPATNDVAGWATLLNTRNAKITR